MEFVKSLGWQVAGQLNWFARNLDLVKVLLLETSSSGTVQISVTKAAGLVLFTLTVAYCG